MDAGPFFDGGPRQLVVLVARPVGEARGEGAEPTGAIGVGELGLDEVDALLARLHGAMAQHEMGEVERPFVRRHVGALGHEAHVAERAGFLDLGVVLLLDAIELAGRAVVYQVEQAREGIAEIEAAPAAVTDVEDALHLLLERLLIPEPRVLPVQGMADGGFKAAFAHDGSFLDKSGVSRTKKGTLAGPPL